MPTSNIISEHNFAMFDNLKTKPHTSVITLESFILWSNNKPSSWVAGKNECANFQRKNEEKETGDY